MSLFVQPSAESPLGRFGNWLAQGTASNASGLSQLLDWQRRRSQEAFFHRGSSDANRAALREKLGIAGDYAKNSPFERGLVDFALDTATDPLTYETMGLGPLVKGMRGAAEAIGRFGSRVAPEAANTARAAHNVVRESFGLGGRNAELLRRSHGQAAKDTVLGATTHSAAEAHHVKTLLHNRINGALKGLSASQQAEVFRVLNGEERMPASGPIATAARALRGVTDDQYYLQLSNRAKQLFPYARAGVRTDVKIKQEEPNLFRYQSTPGSPEFSTRRGSTFFSMGIPAQRYAEGGSLGGSHLIGRVANARNPIDIRYYGPRTMLDRMTPEQIAAARAEKWGRYSHLPSAGVANKVRPGKPTAENLERAFGDKDKKTLDRYLRALGLNDEERNVVFGDNGIYAAEDRIGAELARRHGYDAIIQNFNPRSFSLSNRQGDEFIALTPSATRAPRGVSAKSSNDFESMVPPRVGRVIKARTGNLPFRPYNLPQNLREFSTVPGNESLSKFRKAYVSGLHPQDGATSSREGFTANQLDYRNPNLIARDDLKIDQNDPKRYVDALLKSAENASRAVGSSRLSSRLSDAFSGNVPSEAVHALEQEFGATGEHRSDMQVLLDAARKVTGYGKAASTQLTPFHAANVAALSMLHNLSGTPKVALTAARLLKNRNNPEKTYEILRPGIERGAVGPSHEHDLYFGKIPVLKNWSKLMSDITWGVDNAAKTEYAKSLGSGYSAGRRASEDLIDYRNPSDFSKNVLSLFSKFPTYRSQLLQSVVRGIARNPAKAAALMRATGGTFTGDDVTVGNHKVKLYNSVADAGRAVGDGMGYVRSTLGDPQRAALTLVGVGHGHSPKYFTYGSNVDGKYVMNALAGGLPGGRDLMEAGGQGLFRKQAPGPQALFDFTGISVRKSDDDDAFLKAFNNAR